MNRRGRLAPTPTGFLHVGHAYTFGIAAMRAAGELVFRVDDLDYTRCTDEYIAAAIDDLQWLGLTWAEGPDCGGESWALLPESKNRVVSTSLAGIGC